MIISEQDLKVNELQTQTINQIKSLVNDSTCWDLRIRHNGEFKTFEADFLKDIFRMINDN